MNSGDLLVDPSSAIQAQTPRHCDRRDFVKGCAALVGAAGLSTYNMRWAAAEPAPETRTIRLKEEPFPCEAPVLVAQELLRAEGFSDVVYVQSGTGVAALYNK